MQSVTTVEGTNQATTAPPSETTSQPSQFAQRDTQSTEGTVTADLRTGQPQLLPPVERKVVLCGPDSNSAMADCSYLPLATILTPGSQQLFENPLLKSRDFFHSEMVNETMNVLKHKASNTFDKNPGSYVFEYYTTHVNEIRQLIESVVDIRSMTAFLRHLGECLDHLSHQQLPAVSIQEQLQLYDTRFVGYQHIINKPEYQSRPYVGALARQQVYQFADSPEGGLVPGGKHKILRGLLDQKLSELFIRPGVDYLGFIPTGIANDELKRQAFYENNWVVPLLHGKYMHPAQMAGQLAMRKYHKELHEFLIDIDAWSDVFDKNPVSKLLSFTLKGTVDFRSDRASKWNQLGVANWPTGNSPAHLHKFCCLGLYSQAAKEILNCDSQARKAEFVEQCGLKPSESESLEQCLEKAIRHFQIIETYILDSQNKAINKIAAELKIPPHQVQTTCAQGQGNFDTFKWLAPDLVSRHAKAAVKKKGVRVVRIYPSDQQFLSEAIENPDDIRPSDESFILFKERPCQWPAVETSPQDAIVAEGSTSEASTPSQKPTKKTGKTRKVSRARSQRIESLKLTRRSLRNSAPKQGNTRAT